MASLSVQPASAVDNESLNVDNSRPKKRLLVVDDARCIQKIIVAFLGRMHLDAEMAENGYMACQMAMRSLEKGEPYDLILMDMQMPQMNGRDAVRWLREKNWLGPILAVSVYTAEENHEDFAKIGCNGSVAKPVTEQGLRQAISEYLKC
jgi:CheY-like chemotaxis protein